jgi:hypothetical protein
VCPAPIRRQVRGDGADRWTFGVRMATAAEFAAWLGESVGEKSFILPANVVTALEKAYADGIMEEDDIAEDGTLWTVES